MKKSSLCLILTSAVTLVQPLFAGYFLFMTVFYVGFSRIMRLPFAISVVTIVFYLSISLLNGFDIRFGTISVVFIFFIYLTLIPRQTVINRYVTALNTHQLISFLACLFCVSISLFDNYLLQTRKLDVMVVPTIGMINRFQFLGNPSNMSAAIIAILGLFLIRFHVRNDFNIMICKIIISALIILTFSRAGFILLIPVILYNNKSKSFLFLISVALAVIYSVYLTERLSVERMMSDVRFQYWLYLFQNYACDSVFSCLFGKGQFIVSDNTYLSTYFSFGIFGLLLLLVGLLALITYLPATLTIPLLLFVGFVDIQGNLLFLALLLIYTFFSRSDIGDNEIVVAKKGYISAKYN